jgi:hypothetical protein
MRNLQDLIGFKNADSTLSFRERPYGKGEHAELLCDVIALANATATDPRFLCLGVSDKTDSARTFPGVSLRVWNRTKEVLPRLIEQAIEPQLTVSMREVTVRGALVGVICLDACKDQPYLFRRRVSSSISPGSGWIRRGTEQRPLLRKDLQRIFEAKFRAPEAATDIRVGFPGRVPREAIALRVLPLDALPSALAARRLVKKLDSRQLSKAVLGRTDTRIDRLVHAQVSNEAQTYQSHGTTTLKKMLRQIPQEYESVDEHYQFETRAHKVNLLVANLTDVALSNLVLVLKIPRMEGVGVVERIHAAPGERVSSQERYPVVDTGPRLVTVHTGGISVPKKATAEAFREPLRLYLREPAAGKTIAVNYRLHGRGLHAPIHGTLRIYVTERELALGNSRAPSSKD